MGVGERVRQDSIGTLRRGQFFHKSRKSGVIVLHSVIIRLDLIIQALGDLVLFPNVL
jgi:hypothetical protein